MKKALKVSLAIELKHPKNMILLFLVILAVAGSMLYMQSKMTGEAIYEQTGEYYAIQSALTKFQLMDASEAGDGSPIYKNLHQQKNTVSLQIAALKMDMAELYNKTSLKLANIRANMYAMDDFELVRQNMPSEIENKMAQAYFQELVDRELGIYNEKMQYWAFLSFIFGMIGFAWYGLVSFYTSAILLEDYDHSSVIKGYPIAFHTYVLSKCVASFVYIFLFIGAIFLCTLPLLSLFGAGDASYPVVFYLHDVVIWETWQFIAFIILLMLIVALFVMLLSIILNVWLKNMYLTLFVHVTLFFLPIVFPQLIRWLPWNPFHFMQFNQILDAYPLSLVPPVQINMLHGIGLMVASICVMLFIIKRYFSVGKINRI